MMVPWSPGELNAEREHVLNFGLHVVCTPPLPPPPPRFMFLPITSSLLGPSEVVETGEEV
jgi:hypothetical protein